MKKLMITAETRKEKNTKKVRASGYIPGVVYNHGKTDHIQIGHKELHVLFGKGITEKALIDMQIDKKENEPVFIKNFQRHPVTDAILHIDFFRITYGEKIRTHIPVELLGRPVGVKEGGVLETFIHSIEIETYPRHLVASFKVDISGLNIGDAVHLQDIQLPPDSRLLMEGNPGICQVSSSAKLESELIAPVQEAEEAASEDEEIDKEKDQDKEES